VDSCRPCGDGREHHVGGRQREIVGVVLADPEEVHADLVCQDPLLYEIPDRLRVGERAIVIVVRDIAERVEAEEERELATVVSGTPRSDRRSWIERGQGVSSVISASRARIRPRTVGVASRRLATGGCERGPARITLSA
jgi:hypothetical protein